MAVRMFRARCVTCRHLVEMWERDGVESEWFHADTGDEWCDVVPVAHPNSSTIEEITA